MKLKEIVNATINKRTKQVSFHLKSKILKKNGLTPKSILEMSIPKSNVNFFKGNIS